MTFIDGLVMNWH